MLTASWKAALACARKIGARLFLTLVLGLAGPGTREDTHYRVSRLRKVSQTR